MTGHAHDHVSAAGRRKGRLVAVLVIVLATLALEVAGGLWAGSLSLLADAGHLFTDAVGISVALLGVVVAHRPAPAQRSYGNYRAEVLAALVNGVLLLVVCVVVVVEAVRRLGSPADVTAPVMIAVGAVGMVSNLVCLLLLRDAQAESLTLRGAYLEVLGDLFGSAAVVVAGVCVALTGWDRADVVASLLIAALILPRALRLLKDTVHVLVEGTPTGVDLDALREHLRGVPGVVDVHDLHVWTITSGMPVLSAHVVVSDSVEPGCGADGVLDRLAACVGDHFDVDHSTFQIEPVGHDAHEHVAHD
jgi:cobalt-zinc-cadmium efflux system protein